MNNPTQSLEEATSIAVEFVNSLDNLPSEAQHLLQEIRHKDLRSQEIQQEIAKESAKYIKYSLRHASVPPSPSTPIATTSAAPSPSTPGPKAHLLPKIASSYAEVDRLAEEQLALAQRIVELLARTKARLDADLAKVGVLQGDSAEVPRTGYGVPLSLAATGLGGPDGYATHGRNPAQQISDSLRSALNSSPGPEMSLPSNGNSAGPSAPKKRKLNSNTSIKLPSPAPGQGAGSSGSAYARSRLSRQLLPPRVVEDMSEIGGEEEEGEDEDGEVDDGEDRQIYCFCQKLSYGEMIACDNKKCPYQWFHLPCVNLKAPPEESWFCSECRNQGFGTGRKGRKKQNQQ